MFRVSSPSTPTPANEAVYMNQVMLPDLGAKAWGLLTPESGGGKAPEALRLSSVVV